MEYQGCFQDFVQGRTIAPNYDNLPENSKSVCVAHCIGQSKPVAGTQPTQACFCGYQVGLADFETILQINANKPLLGILNTSLTFSKNSGNNRAS